MASNEAPENRHACIEIPGFQRALTRLWLVDLSNRRGLGDE